jgi:hypothetical protein
MTPMSLVFTEVESRIFILLARVSESVAWQKLCTCLLRTEQKIRVQLYVVPVGLAGPVLFLDR